MVEHSPQQGDQLRSRRCQRIGATSGIVAAVTLAAHLVLLSAAPTIGSRAAVVTEHLVANRTLTLVASYLGVITGIMMLPFLASLRTYARSSTDEDEWRRTVTLLAGSVAVAVVLVGSALLAASAAIADRRLDENAVAAMFAAAKVCLSSSLAPLAVLILTTTRTISPTTGPTRWLIRVGHEVGLVAVISGLVVFFDDNTFGPGELVVAGVGVLVGLWIVAAAITILNGDSAERR